MKRGDIQLEDIISVHIVPYLIQGRSTVRVPILDTLALYASTPLHPNYERAPEMTRDRPRHVGCIGNPLLIGCTHVESVLTPRALRAMRFRRASTRRAYFNPNYHIYPVVSPTIWLGAIRLTDALNPLPTQSSRCFYAKWGVSQRVPIPPTIPIPIADRLAGNLPNRNGRLPESPCRWAAVSKSGRSCPYVFYHASLCVWGVGGGGF